MLCQNCSKAQATTHIKRIINGEATEQHLCAACAKKLGFDSFFDDFSLSIPNFFSGFFSDAVPALAGRKTERCETCGSSFDEIVRTGMVGCADCYDTFFSELMPTIRNIHGNTEHKGKRPGAIEYTVNEEKTDDSADKLTSLKAELKKAIEDENFERAAQLRDEIKGLEG